MGTDKNKGAQIVDAVKMKPTMCLEDDDFIQGVSIGDKVSLSVDAVVRSMSEDECDGKKRRSMRLEISGVTKEKVKSRTDKALDTLGRNAKY